MQLAIPPRVTDRAFARLARDRRRRRCASPSRAAAAPASSTTSSSTSPRRRRSRPREGRRPRPDRPGLAALPRRRRDRLRRRADRRPLRGQQPERHLLLRLRHLLLDLTRDRPARAMARRSGRAGDPQASAGLRLAQDRRRRPQRLPAARSPVPPAPIRLARIDWLVVARRQRSMAERTISLRDSEPCFALAAGAGLAVRDRLARAAWRR